MTLFESDALAPFPGPPQIARLQTRADNLIDLVADGGLAGSKAREKITEIERERTGLEVRLSTINDDISTGADYLKGWLELLRDPYEMYRAASNEMRRELNQAIFKRIWVMDQDRAESELAEPARLLLEAQVAWAESFGLGIDADTNKNDAEASSDNASTREDRLEPVEEALGSSKRSLVPLEGLDAPPVPPPHRAVARIRIAHAQRNAPDCAGGDPGLLGATHEYESKEDRCGSLAEPTRNAAILF
ncbi:MAG: hypothetical protein KF761_03380 [Salinibacterium sp.]|nr:hypothetical protein [Salinibacterium sp.]